MSISALSHAITIYRAMQPRDLVGGDVIGRLKVTDEVIPSLDRLVEVGWMFDSPHKRMSDGTEIDIEFTIKRGQSAFFASSWDDLLSNHDFKRQTPETYYVAEDDFSSEEKKLTVGARRYAAVLSLIKVLCEVADYADESLTGLKLIFLNKTKLELPIKYEAVDLRDVPKVKDLESDLFEASSKHKDQRKVIIKMVLDGLLKDTPEEDRFTKLLSEFTLFTQRYKDSFDLYISEFSFEKVLEEVKAHKLDYTIKLNKVFSDIQNQLLAIPAALILVGGKLAPKGFIEWQNSLTMLGCVIFVALMNLLIRNQHNTLRAILDEISKQNDVLVSKHAAVMPKFKISYEDLERRHAHQKWLITIVDGLVAAMFLFCVLLFYWYSTNEFHWLKYLVLRVIT